MITKGTRSGLSSMEVSWGVSAFVRVILLTRCIIPLKEIVVITTFVKIVNKFIGGECEGLVG